MAFFTRLLLTIFGTAFAVMFTLGVLCWLILYMAFASVRWLVTGQKPQVLMMWQQVQAMRKGMQSGQRPWYAGQGHAQRSGAKPEEVEDVVVREIHDTRNLPKD